MAGYKWHPWIKMIPYDGATETLDLLVVFSDLSGPQSHDVSYLPEIDGADDINRAARPISFGFRPVVTLRMLVFTMSDHQNYSKILNWLADPRMGRENDFGAGVFLSLDNEQTYRRVVMGSHGGPNSISGKTVVGAAFDLTLRCVDLIDEIPYMDPDGSSLVARW